MIGRCAACGFAGAPGMNPTSVEYHEAHRKQHLERFPRSNQDTRDSLDALIEHARAKAFTPPSPEAA